MSLNTQIPLRPEKKKQTINPILGVSYFKVFFLANFGLNFKYIESILYIPTYHTNKNHKSFKLLWIYTKKEQKKN